MTDPLFQDVVGQEKAVALLRAAVPKPVHAYLLVGPPGSGKAAAARGFAAALLCPSGRTDAGPDGTCETCRRVLANGHPDVVDVDREGPAISMGMAQEITRLSSMSPVEGDRKVLVLNDFHLVREAGPALLKTIEEPPATTVFVILAEHVPPELVTIASRCVRVEFETLAPGLVAKVLRDNGVDPERAEHLAQAAGGRLDRARLLATDDAFEMRMNAWRDVPSRLDGTGATSAAVASELVAFLESSAEPMKARQVAEMDELQERNARAAQVNGKTRRNAKAMLNAGVRDLEERHKRELRRHRSDELRTGLAVLAGTYRDRLASTTGPRQKQALAALDLVDEAGRNLLYNPGELLMLQALLARLALSETAQT